jgi:molecular chaperone Hsp33
VSRLTAVSDLIQPFVLEVPSLRGRLVRLGPLVDTVLSRHDYPPSVAVLLGEMLALAAVLSSMLKFEGVFTLQTKGDGPVGLAVVDMTTGGELRAYAEFDAARLAGPAAAPDGHGSAARALLGEGYIAFTVDQGPHTERYQGIVELRGGTLADCLQHYFRQSEQLKTAVKLAAGRVDGTWRAGGLLLQQLPEAEADGTALANDEEDNWRRAVVLMASCTEHELLDPALPDHDLLFRLFHDERVRVYRPRPLTTGCRCSQERLERILRSLPRDEVAEMKVGGEVIMTCQFCSAEYRFDEAALERIYAP